MSIFKIFVGLNVIHYPSSCSMDLVVLEDEELKKHDYSKLY